MIETIEVKVNEAGVLRIRFSGGWVSECTASGIVCWEGLSEEDALALDDQLEPQEKQATTGATAVAVPGAGRGASAWACQAEAKCMRARALAPTKVPTPRRGTQTKQVRRPYRFREMIQVHLSLFFFSLFFFLSS